MSWACHADPVHKYVPFSLNQANGIRPHTPPSGRVARQASATLVSYTRLTPLTQIPLLTSWENSQVVPLVILLLFLGGAAFVGYQIYLSVNKIEQQARDKMAKKNVVFTKDGMRVGVKHVEQEKYVDATQGWVMKAWNMSVPSATKRK